MPPIRPSCATEPDADQSVPSHLPRIVFSIVSAPVSARKTRVPFILIGPPEMRALAIQPSECRSSEEHTSELQSLMRISYAVFCLKKKNTPQQKSERA